MIRTLFKPIDIAPLIYFRILAGALITIEWTGAMFNHMWVDLTTPQFNFSYPLFECIKPWSPLGMRLHFLVVIVAGVGVVLGYRYRLSAFLLCLSTTWLFLMERTLYINHLYLYCLVSLLLIFIPAHRAVSLDARRRPAIETSCVPSWTRSLLLFQISVVYIFAGMAKLDADWLASMPMSVWISAKTDYWLIGPLLAQPWMPELISYGGLLFDLLIVPAMLWRRSRNVAFTLAVVFHLTNVSIFGIGTFPWFSLMATALFYPPERFRRLPLIRSRLAPYRPVDFTASLPAVRRVFAAALIAGYVALQLILPLRQFALVGPTRWTEAGHLFSWRMMLRSKRGSLYYLLTDPGTMRVWRVDPREYISEHQYRIMVGKPDSILEFGQFIAQRYAEKGIPNARVSAVSRISLNGRDVQALVDPRVDMAREERSLGSYPWVLPLQVDEAE